MIERGEDEMKIDKIDRIIHYLKVLDSNNACYQVEVREAITEAINILEHVENLICYKKTE